MEEKEGEQSGGQRGRGEAGEWARGLARTLPRVDTAVAIADARVLHLIARSDRAVVPRRAILLKHACRVCKVVSVGQVWKWDAVLFFARPRRQRLEHRLKPPYARRPMAADKDRDRDVCEA